MIYEIRVYEAVDGKAEAMKARFKSEVVRRFPGHGIELLGVFESETDRSRLTYVTRFRSEDHRSEAWEAFSADPEWCAVKAATEKEGPLLKSQTVSVLSPALAGLLLE
jgi:heme-degrading monooxygenase HmoA